jgi:1-acyl-sn-glycerol-3-phosphate acyltransferase
MLQQLALGAFRLGGWRLSGTPPDLKKYLIVLAPHTCNFDWLLGMLGAAGFGLRLSWLGKSTIFRWPAAGFLRHLGGIPVQREHQHGVVQEVVDAYAAADSLIVGMTPEGTRRRTPGWKSGFYHIALEAGIPVVPAAINRPARRIILGPPLTLSGDRDRDMEAIRSFYAGVEGVHPEKASPVRLCDEAHRPRPI